MAQQTFEELVAAVKQAESRGKRYADDGKTLTTSAKGALGEMQVMPKTVANPGYGVTPAKDKSADEIARVGVDYLQAMKQKYGDTDKALVAYNMGPGATDKWIAAGAKTEALPAETKTYVERVKGFLGGNTSREAAVAKKEVTPAEEVMTKALPAGTTAQATFKNMPDMANMPASYQAAFALAALADAKDEEDDKAFNENKPTEAEKLLADYKPINHLASLDLSVKPLRTLRMAGGGEVGLDGQSDGEAEGSSEDSNINFFNNVNRMRDQGVTTDSVMLGASKKFGDGSLMGGLNMANMSKDEKLQTARALMLAYTQQDPEGLGINANVVKPLSPSGPSMKNLMGSLPLGEGRVSAGMQGNKAYSLGYSQPVEGGQFNANLNVPRNNPSAAQLNLQYNKRFADGGDVTARQDEPFFDAASRTFVDVLTGRRTPITEKDFTAKEQMAMMDAVKKSQARGGNGRVDYQDYPSGDQIGPGYVDIRNTLGGFQYKQNPDGSTSISDRYDFHGPRVAEYEKMGTGEKVLKSAANALTEFVKGGFSPRDLAGELGRAYIGSKGPDVNIRIPVNRAEGGDAEPTAEEIAAASTPAFIAQKSGIGRKQGNISKAIQSGTAHQAIGEGIKDVPYDLAGIPVDLTTMVMRPFGYKNEKPFLGSEYLKEKATEAGIRNPTSTDPTLKGFHTLGEFGAGMMAPGKVIEGAQALKSKAADMLTKFQESRTAKPGMTDMMTGQRVEAPEITPQMATEFSQWRQQAQNQVRNQNPALAQNDQVITNAIFDNLAGVNQQQIAADVAAGRLPGFVAPVPALLRAEQNIARLPADAQEQLRLFEEAAAAPARPRPVAITQPPTQLPPPPPYVAPPVQVSAEFPFVGRLDEFAAAMKGPAQKEQLINQVKGKFREHDVARLEEALAGLGPKDKVTPAMLQEALANTYSPSRFRSVDVPAGQSGMYNVHDNIFHGNKDIAGAMNLYLKETPETVAFYGDYLAVKKAAEKVLYGRKPEDITVAVESLRNNPLTAKVPEINTLIDRMEAALPAYTKFGKMQDEVNHAENMIMYPVLYSENGFNFHREIDRRTAPFLEGMTMAERNTAMWPIRKQQETQLTEELMQKGSDKLVALGGDPIDVPAFMQRNANHPSPNLAGGSDQALITELKDITAPIKDGINAAMRKVRENIHTSYDKVYEELRPYTGYKGQHESVTNKEINPIGFSRYTEHAVDMNGKQLNGRHVHELQSDLAQDVKQLGPKNKSLEKDREELATLKSKLAGIDELDPTQKIEKAKLDNRIDILERRITVTAPGKYHLEQPFAGFETSPSVEMQLLMKNAIQATMRAGQDFVTFPGKESARPALYEKVLPNLKQAVKDLGGEKAGFDIKPITLPNPGGTEPTVWGVVWSPETAAKVMQKGVPFKKGGMVERKNDDNRRYL
jgi:hypothetical protein